ncbi:MAG: protein kinase domain-containing protein [bacterium]
MFTPNDIVELEQSTYKIDKVLSDSGAQGVVWQVTGKDNKLYALKVALLQDTHSPATKKKIIKYANEEINFLRGLPSDASAYHIAPCLDAGTIERGGDHLPAFIMPLYESDLGSYLKLQRSQNKVITIQQWLRWFWQLLQALQYMQKTTQHESLSVHRDLKPANLLLDKEQNLYLSDFGIVRASNIVGTYTQAFTPAYSAPEQILTWYITESGHPHFYITPAVDIYAAALILHDLIAGGTKAQDHLESLLDNDKKKFREQHKAIILTQDNRTMEYRLDCKVGLLGEVGGLTHTEYDYFLSQLNQRFLADTQTMVVPSQKSLPNYGELVHHYGDLVKSMLAPLPKDRPDANQVLSKLLELKEQLYPELSYFKLAHSVEHSPLTVPLWKPLVISLDIQGKGLPNNLDWLEIKINNRLIRDVEGQLISSQPSSHCKNEFLRHYRLYLPAFEDIKVEPYTLHISGIVNGQEKMIVKEINVTIDSEYLWQKGRRADALGLFPKKSWLDEWEKSAKTVEEKNDLINVIKTLKDCYPEKVVSLALNDRIDRINHSKPIITNFFIIGGIGIFIIFLLIIASLILSKNTPNEPEPINTPPNEQGITPVEYSNPIDTTINPSETAPSFVQESSLPSDKEVDQKYKSSPFFKEAQAGNPKSQYELGFRYVQDKNYDEAMIWYQKSADQQYAPAQAGMGWLYFRKKTKENDREAVKWLKLAATQNNKDGQYLLGIMYANGRGGLLEDHTEAQRLYCLAAKQGLTKAQEKLDDYLAINIKGAC